MRDATATYNELLKIGAGLFSSSGLAIMILTILRPVFGIAETPNWLGGALGLAIWAISLYIIGYTRRKDS